MMISAMQSDKQIPLNISIKPVVIPDDIGWLQQWLGVGADCLIPFYESLEASSFIQSMVVWEHDTPVLQVDICEALFDDLGAGDDFAPGDYSLRLLFAPDATVDAISRSLYNCVDYVFMEKKANSILMPVHKSNKLLIAWVKDTGFTLVKHIQPKPEHALYVLNKPVH